MKSERDFYFVAVKVFLEHQGKFLVCKDSFGDWDIPGGRIQKHEFAVPLEKIVARKMREELGSNVRYTLGKPIVFMRHERTEAGSGKKVRIFAVGYQAKYLGGSIKFSERHAEYLWVSPKNFKPEKYFKGGWLRGVREYIKLKV